MSDSYSNSSPLIHHMFRKSDFPPGMNQKLDFISFIWEDDRIEKPDNNQCKCIWCNNTFRGINASKALDHAIGIRGMHIRFFFRN